MSFSAETTAEQVADAFASEIAEKNVLITGTSIGGIGFETARAVAKYANLVIITGHDAERLQLTEDAIKKDFPSANIRKLILDLSSLATVRDAATEVIGYDEKIDVLINNAGAPLGPPKSNPEGFENQIATSHLGPFLFTNLIPHKLIVAGGPPGRVVFVSSLAHAMGPGIKFDQFAKLVPGKYANGMEPYQEAKSANIMTAIELSKRAKGRIVAVSLHPGAIVTTGSQNPESKALLMAAGIYTPDGEPNRALPFPWKTLAQGAATTMVAAFDPSLSDKPGAFLHDCQVATQLIAPHTSDPENVKKLWEATERAIGQEFDP
ncbi:NAD-P-binding protein [Roridomyces roridus]|uniref:NAD-P-binding protein n=1 Tax=Roridomyces roridus TaxID=1738132 RepID=A0AAD7FAX9_9AGAR|nr:NAD-P-binding protein [Roridomyces roridus]